MDWDSIRSEFPLLSTRVYLNTSGGGLLCRDAIKAGTGYFDAAADEAFASSLNWIDRLEDIRSRFASLINAYPDEVAFLPNSSTGIAYIALALRSEFPEDTEVMVVSDEFPAGTFPWMRAGFKLRVVQSDPDGRFTPQLFEAALTPKCKVLCLSLVGYATGFNIDLNAYSALAKKHGLIFVLDATQGMTVVPLDVRASGINFMTCSGYKSIMAGFGWGGFFGSREMFARFKFPLAGWRSVKAPMNLKNQELDIREGAPQLELGTPNFPVIFALGASLDLINQIGAQRIYARIDQLREYLITELRKTAFATLFPATNENSAGIVILPCAEPASIQAKLEKKGIYLVGRQRGLRIGLHFYNNFTDIDRLTAALAELAP